MRILCSVILALSVSNVGLAEKGEGGKVPTPQTPVFSPPFGPGECVVACVPESTGGGGGVGVNGPGGVGGSAEGGGGSTGGTCKMYCNPEKGEDEGKGGPP